jgi:hypothetical protein
MAQVKIESNNFSERVVSCELEVRIMRLGSQNQSTEMPQMWKRALETLSQEGS